MINFGIETARFWTAFAVGVFVGVFIGIWAAFFHAVLSAHLKHRRAMR